MMTSIVFEQWCEQLRLSPATRKLLAGIRCSPPVRRVTFRAKNVSGTYPSSKMNRTIQFESQVEQRAILVMEYDPEVLEFYDRPTTFRIHYQSGKKRVGPYYTPDFLVLRRTSATFDQLNPKMYTSGMANHIILAFKFRILSYWAFSETQFSSIVLGMRYSLIMFEKQRLKRMQWMGPITTAIVAALSAGAVSGLTKTSKTAITDAYDKLEDLLIKKLGARYDMVQALDQLEAKQGSADLKETLHAVNAEQDEEILTARYSEGGHL